MQAYASLVVVQVIPTHVRLTKNSSVFKPFYCFYCFKTASQLRVEVVMQRKAEKVTLNRKEREGVKARDILKKYPQEKAEALMSNLKKKGLWYYDPDFENDDEDCLNWWVGPLQAIKV